MLITQLNSAFIKLRNIPPLQLLQIFIPYIGQLIIIIGILLISIIMSARVTDFDSRLVNLENNTSSTNNGVFIEILNYFRYVGRVLYLPLGEIKENEFVTGDSVQQNVHIYGATVSQLGRYFDGDQDFIEIIHDDSQNLSDVFSITAWVKLDDANDFRTILSKNASGSGFNDPMHLRVEKDSGVILGRIGDGNIDNNISGTTDINDQHWHFICFVVSESDLQLYVDGRTDAERKSRTINLIANTTNLRLGTWQGYHTGAFWKGEIGEVNIYQRILYLQEIQQIYADDISNYE